MTQVGALERARSLALRYARSLRLPEHDAEDVAQDVMLLYAKAARERRWKNATHRDSWLVVATKHRCLKRYDKSWRRPAFEDDASVLFEVAAPEPEDSAYASFLSHLPDALEFAECTLDALMGDPTGRRYRLRRKVRDRLVTLVERETAREERTSR